MRAHTHIHTPHTQACQRQLQIIHTSHTGIANASFKSSTPHTQALPTPASNHPHLTHMALPTPASNHPHLTHRHCPRQLQIIPPHTHRHCPRQLKSSTPHTQALPTPASNHPHLTHMHCPRQLQIIHTSHTCIAQTSNAIFKSSTPHTHALPKPPTPSSNHPHLTHMHCPNLQRHLQIIHTSHTSIAQTSNTIFKSSTPHTQALPKPPTPSSNHLHLTAGFPQTFNASFNTQLTHRHCPSLQHQPQNQKLKSSLHTRSPYTSNPWFS
ncbi:hypothetical protein HNY73_001869 [Argiope bruennichi]|uniref:Uncharacterized protein n=1 Tax=Argiope bruennichi TaxID=94029 RepID=A0A8T0FRX8_ARGBR|nr:hypothetical protein HNY73_001869 [Argiope bruennichi]